MTIPQAKLLALIRSRGWIDGSTVNACRWRCVYPLYQSGHVEYVKCEECMMCKGGYEAWRCLAVKVVPTPYKSYKESTKAIVDQAIKFATEKKDEGWTRNDFIVELAKILEPDQNVN